MIHLRRVVQEREEVDEDRYPFAVPAVRSARQLDFDRPVTFFVGENGSGKSTLIEAIAWATDAVAAGSAAVDVDASLAHVRPLGEALRLTWNQRTRRGFFLRAEDFFGYVKRTQTEIASLESEIARVMDETEGLPEAERARRAGPFSGSLAALRRRYGRDPDARSHGEQFINFFQQRLAPGGLYLLDEPEAPLSPMRQLALLSVLREAIDDHECQFIISTHSPILMALPDATILSFDDGEVRQVAYDEVEHVSLMRSFLNRPEAYLRHL